MTTQLEMVIRMFKNGGVTVPVSGDRIATAESDPPKLSEILDWEADAYYRGVQQPEQTLR